MNVDVFFSFKKPQIEANRRMEKIGAYSFISFLIWKVTVHRKSSMKWWKLIEMTAHHITLMWDGKGIFKLEFSNMILKIDPRSRRISLMDDAATVKKMEDIILFEDQRVTTQMSMYVIHLTTVKKYLRRTSHAKGVNTLSSTIMSSFWKPVKGGVESFEQVDLFGSLVIMDESWINPNDPETNEMSKESKHRDYGAETYKKVMIPFMRMSWSHLNRIPGDGSFHHCCILYRIVEQIVWYCDEEMIWKYNHQRHPSSCW